MLTEIKIDIIILDSHYISTTTVTTIAWNLFYSIANT